MQGEAPDDRSEIRMQTVRRLVEEVGISEAEAMELTRMLGADWSSLLREARLILRKRRKS